MFKPCSRRSSTGTFQCLSEFEQCYRRSLLPRSMSVDIVAAAQGLEPRRRSLHSMTRNNYSYLQLFPMSSSMSERELSNPISTTRVDSHNPLTSWLRAAGSSLKNRCTSQRAAGFELVIPTIKVISDDHQEDADPPSSRADDETEQPLQQQQRW